MKKKISNKVVAKVAKKIEKKVIKEVAKKIEMPVLEDAYPIYLVAFMVREFRFDGTGEAKRAIREGRVSLNGEVVTDINLELQPKQKVSIEVDRDGSGSKL